MLRPPVTIPIVFVCAMLAGARARGRPFMAWVIEAGIAPELLQQAGARVTTAQCAALIGLLIDHLDDEGMDFLSRPLKRGSLAMTVRSALTAPNLEVAIHRVAHTIRLLQDDVLLESMREGPLAGVALRFAADPPTRQNFLDELMLRVIWRVFAWLVGGQLPVRRFDFAFAAPPYVRDYEKVFPASLKFGCPQSAFWFEARWLKEPVRRDEAALRAFLAEAQSNVLMPRRQDEVISNRVRSHLQQTQPTWPDLAATAKVMHMAPSTLQRHLATEKTTFQSLKDELRRDLAILRLNTTTVPLATLASELGFTDNASFQRAFKGWTGSAPGAYRRGGLTSAH